MRKITKKEITYWIILFAVSFLFIQILNYFFYSPATINTEQCSDTDLMQRYDSPQELKTAIKEGNENCNLSDEMQKLLDSLNNPNPKNFTGIVIAKP